MIAGRTMVRGGECTHIVIPDIDLVAWTLFRNVRNVIPPQSHYLIMICDICDTRYDVPRQWYIPDEFTEFRC